LGLRAGDDGTGLAVELSPGWGTGAEAPSGNRLLDAFRQEGATSAPEGRVDARVSWGMRAADLVAGTEVLRPWAELSLGEASRLARAGVALEGAVRVDLALERRESGTGAAEHGVMVRLDTRF